MFLKHADSTTKAIVTLAIFVMLASFFNSMSAKAQTPPEGKILFVGEDWNIWTMNTDGSDTRQLTTDADGTDLVYGRIAWSPDGNQILFSSGRLGVEDSIRAIPTFEAAAAWAMNIDGSGKREQKPSDRGKMSPDGRKIAFVAPEGDSERLYILDTATNMSIDLFEGNWVRSITFSPAGNLIGFQAEDKQGERHLYIARSDGEYLFDYSTSGGCIVFSPDEQSVISVASGEINVINIVSGEFYQLALLDSSIYYSSCPWLSPDGQEISIINSTLSEYKVVTMDWNGQELRKVTLQVSEELSRIILFPNGKHIFSSTVGGGGYMVSRMIYDLENGAETRLFFAPTTFIPYGGSSEVLFSELIFSQPLSPDTEFAVYESNGEIFVTKTDGSGEPNKLAYGASTLGIMGMLAGPRWQPDVHALEDDGESTNPIPAPMITFPSTADGAIPATSFTGEIRGTALPNTTVKLYWQIGPATDQESYGEEIASVESDEAGNWIIDGVYLKEGENILIVLAEMDGKMSDPSNALHVMASPTTIPAITYPPSVDGRVSAKEFNGEIAGNGPPNSLVFVYQRLADAPPANDDLDEDEPEYTFINSEGNWMLTGLHLLPGENVFAAVAEVDGTRSEPSAPLYIYMPPTPVITHPPSVYGRVRTGDFDGKIAGTGPPDSKVFVYSRLADEQPVADKPYGDEVFNTSINSQGGWSWSPLYLIPREVILVAVAQVDGVWSEPSENLYIQNSTADAYGAKYTWAWGEDEYLRVSMENLDTREEVEYSTRLLGSAGYASHAHLNVSANDAYANLERDRIFYFSGHGSNSCLSFEVEPGDNSSLCASEINDSLDLSYLSLAVLNACETGKDLKAADNIMRAFQQQGAETVIGFKHSIETEIARAWNISFWDYALNDGYNVGYAAYQAARDVGDWWWPDIPNWGIDEDAIVVIGNSDLWIVLNE